MNLRVNQLPITNGRIFFERKNVRVSEQQRPWTKARKKVVNGIKHCPNVSIKELISETYNLLRPLAKAWIVNAFVPYNLEKNNESRVKIFFP